MSALAGEREHEEIPLTAAVSDAVAQMLTDGASGGEQYERVSSSRAVAEGNSMPYLMGTRDSELQLIMSDSSTPTASQQKVASGVPIAEEQSDSDEVLQTPNVEEDENAVPLVTASMPNLTIAPIATLGAGSETSPERRTYSAYCVAVDEEGEANGDDDEEDLRASTPRADGPETEDSAFNFTSSGTTTPTPGAAGPENPSFDSTKHGEYDNEELLAMVARHNTVLGSLHDASPATTTGGEGGHRALGTVASSASCPQLERSRRGQGSAQDQDSLDSFHI